MARFATGQGLLFFCVAGASALAAALHAHAQSGCQPAWNNALVGSGTNGLVRAIVVSPDGSTLGVGGDFLTLDGEAMSNLGVRENGVWIDTGGVNSGVFDLVWFDDGSGESLFATGRFTSAGQDSAARIARWDGSAWHALGTGLDDTGLALCVHDDGAGPALYAGGQFETAGGVTTNGVARWDGSSWSAVGGGITLGGEDIGVVTLVSHPTPQGNLLIAGGRFDSAGGLPASNVAAWDGVSWSALGAGLSEIVYDLESVDLGAGPVLFAGGEFDASGSTPISKIAQWDGTQWQPVPAGGVDQSAGRLRALHAWDDGSGDALFVAGLFLSVGGVDADHVAKWDGAAWSALAPGIGWEGLSLGSREGDPQQGGVLYVGGDFSKAGGAAQSHLGAWAGCATAPEQPRADLTQDGLVGPADLSVLLSNWGGSGPADLTGDGVINAADLSIVLAEWGAGG